MDILVNDVRIDFTLENESTLGEVFTELDRWLRGNGHVVDTVSINGASQFSDDTSWHGAPIAGVETFSITARSLREDEVHEIETIYQYLDLLRRILQSGSDAQLADILAEYSYVAQSLPRYAPSAGDALSAALDGVTVENGERAISVIAPLLAILEERQRELLEPEREARATVTALRGALAAVESVPTQLQSGEDASAMAAITTFTELAGKILRILPLLLEISPDLAEANVDGQAMDTFVAGINATLGEAVDAFGREDFVLLGDLLEYEIVPRMGALLDHLERDE